MNDHYIPFCSPHGHKFAFIGMTGDGYLFKCSVCGKYETRMYKDKSWVL